MLMPGQTRHLLQWVLPIHLLLLRHRCHLLPVHHLLVVGHVGVTVQVVTEGSLLGFGLLGSEEALVEGG